MAGSSTEHVDTVIVGSGFGGSVTAYRLAEAGQQVIVLERGRAYPPGSFPRAPQGLAKALWDPSEGLLGLFDVWSFHGFAGVVSSALGGGSHIYANVLLRKDEKWFVTDDPETDDGYRPWPVTRADLDPHYDDVERMLGVQQFPFNAPGYEASGKTTAMRDAAQGLGLEWQLPPLAVTFTADGRTEPGVAIPDPPYGNIHGRQRTTCQLVGECDIGCQYGSKNSLDHTYLSAAAHFGADIRTFSEVQSFEPTRRGWAVSYVARRPEHEGQRIDSGTLPLTTITCDRLLLGAGTFGTTYLLLRNRAALPGLSRMLGHRFCGNGDLLGFVWGARDEQGQARYLGSSAAPVITSTIRVPDALDGGTGRGLYLQDGGYPGFVDWLVEASDVPGVADRVLDAAHAWVLTRLMRDPKANVSARVSRVLGSGSRSAGATVLLGMGRDVPDGVMRLRRGLLDIDWTTRTSREHFDRVHDTMRQVAEEIGGCYVPNPLSWLNRVITVHPLGGAPMGRSVDEGVIDSYGEVFGHPGLFVVDGAAMPGPVGPNPSLTIAAFADRAATAILEERTAKPSTPARRVTAPVRRRSQAVADPNTHGAGRKVAFGEEVKGHFAFDVSDPEKGAEQGRADSMSIAVHLQVELDDLDGLAADPRPRRVGWARGWVDCDALGGRLPISDGWMMAVGHDDDDSLKMRYRLFLTDSVGHPLTLVAWRDVRRGSVLDLWRDATMRPFLLLAGHIESQDLERRLGSDARSTPRIVGAGVVSIPVLDLARSLISFRAATDPLGQVRTLAKFSTFAKFALGSLWRLYRPSRPTRPGESTETRS
jgi:cholesterol oxidase